MLHDHIAALAADTQCSTTHLHYVRLLAVSPAVMQLRVVFGTTGYEWWAVNVNAKGVTWQWDGSGRMSSHYVTVRKIGWRGCVRSVQFWVFRWLLRLRWFRGWVRIEHKCRIM